MSDLNKQNPTLETQNKSVGIQDNSMKPVSNKSDKTYFHKKSSNPDSHSVIVKPNKSAEMIPTGRKDTDGNPTFRRGKYDYRFGMYTEFDAEGNPIHPDNMDWKDNVECVFDDRQKVVDMWREIGLTCMQVAPGNF